MTTATSLRLPDEPIDMLDAEAQVQNHGSATHGNWVTDVTRDTVEWDYSYVASGWDPLNTPSQVTITAPLGFSRTVAIHSAYNVRPRITSITDSLGQVTSYDYDPDVRPIRITYPEGNAVEVVYDMSGNITRRKAIAKPGSGLADLVEEADFITSQSCAAATCFKPVATRDAKGQQTDYSWGDHGGLLTRLEPADADGERRKTINEWDESSGVARLVRERVCMADGSGVELTCGTAAERVREFSYWGDTLLPLSETATDGAGTQALTTVYSYDAAGRVLGIDGPLPGDGDSTHYRYDAAGRRTWEIGPERSDGYRAATRTTYRDADDQPLKVERGVVTSPTDTVLIALGEERHQYGLNRKVERSILAAGGTDEGVTQFAYDALNREQCSALRMNPAAWDSLPADACALGAEGSYGPDRIVKTHYDAESRVTRIQQALGTAVEADYAQYSYSANGNRLTVEDGNGNVAGMSYDGFDRQVKWSFPSKTVPGVISATDYEAYGYDANGNRISLRKRDGSVLAYQYDGLDRMIVKTVPERAGLDPAHTRDVHYGYGPGDEPAYARFDSPNGEGVSYGYDSLGRLTSTTSDMGGTARTLSYMLDAGGRRTRVTHPDGTWFGYEHDDAGLPTAIRDDGGQTLASFAHDLHGRRASIARANGAVTTYSYDGLSRLTRLAQDMDNSGHDLVSDLAYNPASQIVSKIRDNNAYVHQPAAASIAYQVNGLNQYESVDGAAFGYDDNGNLTSDPGSGSGAGGATSFLYDVENRLVSASGARNATLSYDPLGRLYELDPGSGSGAGSTRFLYDPGSGSGAGGDALVAEYDGQGNLQRRYVHGPGVDEPLVVYAHIGWFHLRYFLHADERGSIIAVSDNNGGNYAINRYDEYGVPDAANEGRFQYTGQAWLDELGLYHYKARLYDPALGRFLQTDPIGYEDQINLYAYVGNDPVNLVDPTGETCEATEEGNYTCKLDDTGDLSKKEIAAAEAAYTKVVNELMAIPDTKIELSVEIADGLYVSMETTAGEIGEGLIDAQMIYGGENDQINASEVGGTITLYDGAISRGEQALMSTLAHEGAHTTPVSDALRAELPRSRSGFNQFKQGHQKSFKTILQRIREQRARDYNRKRGF